MTTTRTSLMQTRRWVIKLGSAILTNNGLGLKTDSLAVWVAQIAALRARGCDVVLVSSGAVAEGVVRLGWTARPHAIHELQAAAAVGQSGLIQAYESCFQTHGIRTAQILLSYDDIADRERYLNARSTLKTLLALGVVPIINENDTVATDEIRFGDNDTLAGLVANLIEAQTLVILTDQAGLYDRDPRSHADAKLVDTAQAGDPALQIMAGEGTALGRGGMLTKLKAAVTAAKSGTQTVIAAGQEPDVLVRIAAGEALGTWLQAGSSPLAARKQWLAGQSIVRGRLTLDAGAVKVLREHGRSLLAVGVTAVQGEFKRGEIVACLDADGEEVARGLVNYDADATQRIMGQPTSRFEELLGFLDEPELIHRDNLILL
ncbi:MAG: glutamate 5-kinase [Gammaproteobacteria bacterium]